MNIMCYFENSYKATAKLASGVMWLVSELSCSMPAKFYYPQPLLWCGWLTAKVRGCKITKTQIQVFLSGTCLAQNNTEKLDPLLPHQLSLEVRDAGCLEHTSSQGPDLRNILWQSYNFLTIMTYDRRIIYQTSYEERRSNSSVQFTCKIIRSPETVFVN